MGFDTVRFSYSPPFNWHFLVDYHDGWDLLPDKSGRIGPVWFQRFKHEVGIEVTVKGCGSDPYVLWEGSVPKTLGICGPAEAEHVRYVDKCLRDILSSKLPAPMIRRCDLTHDEYDPDRKLLEAAKGWQPHPRSRYYERRIADRIGDPVNSVFLANKTRGVRVYDNYAEKKEEWARDTTRVEYQVRGNWLVKYGLDRLYEDLDRNHRAPLGDLVNELMLRVKEAGPSEAADSPA